MSDSKEFIGRARYLEEFDTFLNSSNPLGHVMIVVGEQGMGKTSLLQAMARRVAKNDHVVALGEITNNLNDFPAQIYPLIAQIKARPKLEIGEGSDWLKTGLAGFAIASGVVFAGTTAVFAGGIAGLGSILTDIIKRQSETGSSPITLAEMFHYELARLDEKIGGAKRIVIILDPEKESPTDIIHLLHHMSQKGMPSKVRFIIAQRRQDVLMQAYVKGECDGVCREPLCLERLIDQDQNDFIASRDIDGRLTEEVRAELVSRYNGWPLLLEQAITDLLLKDSTITPDDVRSLPEKIEDFWQRRYEEIQNENSLKLVQTACMLPHPYPIERLAKFAGLTQTSAVAALHEKSVWGLMDKVAFEDMLTQEMYGECLAPKHATARDYVRNGVHKNSELEHELLDQIISHYREIISDDLECATVDRDALVYLPQTLIAQKDASAFLNEVNRLGPIKNRYGLLDSYLADLAIALRINEELGRKEGMASDYGNMGNVYLTRGELDKAFEMYEKSLAINEELGRKEGMASDYGNMGNVYGIRGELDKAEEYWMKSLKLFELIGSKDKIKLVRECLETLRNK